MVKVNVMYAIQEGHIKILKIERPKYEVVEEKKELLTEEEKEFLRQNIKFLNIKIYAISIEMTRDQKTVHFENVSGSGFWYYIKNNFFNNLEIDKVYTLKELGLEEK